jgi:hypothetical protein
LIGLVVGGLVFFRKLEKVQQGRLGCGQWSCSIWTIRKITIKKLIDLLGGGLV